RGLPHGRVRGASAWPRSRGVLSLASGRRADALGHRHTRRVAQLHLCDRRSASGRERGRDRMALRERGIRTRGAALRSGIRGPDMSAERELPELSREEMLRYSRHLILPEVALEGQRRLKGSSVLIVGAGGLGSPLALYLAAAGVGRLGLVDFDVVDET